MRLKELLVYTKKLFREQCSCKLETFTSYYLVSIWKHCLSSQLFLNVTTAMIQYCFQPVESWAGSFSPVQPYHVNVFSEDVKETGLLGVRGNKSDTQSSYDGPKKIAIPLWSYFGCLPWYLGVLCVFCRCHSQGSVSPNASSKKSQKTTASRAAQCNKSCIKLISHP